MKGRFPSPTRRQLSPLAGEDESRGTVFRSLDDARALLLAGATRLESYPAAGVSAGPGWFQAVVETLEAEFPDRAFDAVLDCGAEPGAVLAALRRGVKHVKFSGAPQTTRRLSDIAAQLGAVLEPNETAG